MIQSEAKRRAQAKYYAKLRENEEHRSNMAQRSRHYYQKPENKEKHTETVENIIQPIKKRLINISWRREKEINEICSF
jgi:hypothetical protein